MKPRKVAVVLVSLLALLVIGLAIHQIQTLPDGPQPVNWDREVCTECHMLISDRHFAAQLQTSAGEVLNFDDPGCLMTYVARRQRAIHAMYFRDSQSGQWLKADEVGFIRAAQSPMGHGLAAARKTVPGTLTYAAALHALQHASGPQGGM